MTVGEKLQLKPGQSLFVANQPFGTDLNRDSLWELLSGDGIRPVRQIAIDDTWSALRFRPS